jgi:hypothetical protein
MGWPLKRDPSGELNSLQGKLLAAPLRALVEGAGSVPQPARLPRLGSPPGSSPAAMRSSRSSARARKSGSPSHLGRSRSISARKTSHGSRRRSHQHVPTLAEHSVDRVGVELDALGVDYPVVHFLEPEFGAAAACDLRREVEISRPRSPRMAAAAKPVSPGPAESSSTVSPGRGASSPINQLRTGLMAFSSCARQCSQPGAIACQAP